MPPETAHVSTDAFERKTHHQMRHGLDGSTADFIAATDGKRQTVTFQPRLIGFKNHIGGRIIGVRVHRIRAVERLGSRKTYIQYAQGGDSRHSVVAINQSEKAQAK